MSDADTVAVRPVGAEANGGLASRLGFDSGRAVKFVAAVALLPVCVGFAVAFHHCFWSLGTQARVAFIGWPALFKWLLAGVGAYAVVGILLFRPVFVYAFAHEMVHALATWLCLGSVTNFSAATTGGQVTTSKSNTFIRLAPYVVPFYPLIVAAVFVGFDMAGRPLNQPELLAGLLGFTLAFHIGFTLWSLHRSQSDLKKDGWFFSLVVVFLLNLLILSALLGLALSGKPAGAWESLRYVCQEGWQESLSLFSNLAAAAKQAIARG